MPDTTNENMWEMTAPPPNPHYDEITKRLDGYNDQYGGRLVQLNKNNDYYRITGFFILNKNGSAEYAVHYHPYDPIEKQDFHKIKHTRPAREFFDGRFKY